MMGDLGQKEHGIAPIDPCKGSAHCLRLLLLLRVNMKAFDSHGFFARQSAQGNQLMTATAALQSSQSLRAIWRRS